MRITRRKLRRIIKESLNETLPGDEFGPGGADEDRPWGTYARHPRNDDDHFWDTIMMSPNGDSLLVDGRETYLEDVPSQITATSGIEMNDTDADNLIFALETQMQDGYVELGVEYKDGKWSW
jgi:hypothetical protein